MQKAGIVALAPSALIPTLGPIICIGLVGAALFKLLKDDDLDSELVGDEKSAADGQELVSADILSAPQLEENEESDHCDQTIQAVADLNKQEVIRQAMSELGKRSGAARAKKATR